MPFHREHIQQDNGDKEIRQGIAEKRQQADQLIPNAVFADGGENAQRQGQEQG